MEVTMIPNYSQGKIISGDFLCPKKIPSVCRHSDVRRPKDNSAGANNTEGFILVGGDYA